MWLWDCEADMVKDPPDEVADDDEVMIAPAVVARSISRIGSAGGVPAFLVCCPFLDLPFDTSAAPGMPSSIVLGSAAMECLL